LSKRRRRAQLHITCAPEDGRFSGAIPKRLRLGQLLEPSQRHCLDLAHALARHPEGATDLFQGARPLTVQSVAKLDHVALAL